MDFDVVGIQPCGHLCCKHHSLLKNELAPDTKQGSAMHFSIHALPALLLAQLLHLTRSQYLFGQISLIEQKLSAFARDATGTRLRAPKKTCVGDDGF